MSPYPRTQDHRSVTFPPSLQGVQQSGTCESIWRAILVQM